MGEFFQIQDDFLDCYGDPKVIGKIGRDIEENKCSWLIVQALLHANADQKRVLEVDLLLLLLLRIDVDIYWSLLFFFCFLQQHYGRDNPSDVAHVKKVYQDLNMTKIFQDYERESYQKLLKMIAEVRSMQQDVFIDLLNKIYKRKL